MITCTFEDGDKGQLRHVVVDTLVLQDNKILLAKRAKKLSLEGGKWGLLGGYVGRDETTKEAAKREVMEESGYEITDIQLLTIRDNPDRPKENRQNIAFIYIAQASEKTGTSDWEVSDLEWFALDEVPKDEVAFDHYKNIELYLDHKRKGTSLPIFSKIHFSSYSLI